MPRLDALPMKRVWPLGPRHARPERVPTASATRLADAIAALDDIGDTALSYAEVKAIAAGSNPLTEQPEPGCDHNDIDTRAKRCRECGQPVTQEQADYADERRHEQQYGTGR